MNEKNTHKKTVQQASVYSTVTNKKVSQVRVISSVPLDTDATNKIEEFIGKKHANPAKLVFDYEVDSSILGGLLIVDGDKYYDGTLRTQLIVIRKQLSKE